MAEPSKVEKERRTKKMSTRVRCRLSDIKHAESTKVHLSSKRLNRVISADTRPRMDAPETPSRTPSKMSIAVSGKEDNMQL